jgi:hypothetical protein
MTSPVTRHSDYRYIFGSLRTERIIAEIPLFGTYMDLELNVGGRFDGSFQLDQTGKRNQDLVDATIPGKCFVIVERNGVPIWGGFVWSRTYQSQAKSLQLYCQHFMQYPTYQLIRSDFFRFGSDQQQVFLDLWAHMQAVPGRNININQPAVAPTMALQKLVDVRASDFKYYGEIMSTLADANDGFDWLIDINAYNDGYIKTLRTGYPSLGSLDPSRMIFEYPGSILNYYATEAMTDAGTNVFTVGSGEGDAMPFHEEVAQDLLDTGFARWDVLAPRKEIESQTDLDVIGVQEGLVRRPPKLVFKPELKADVVPEFGSFGLGDAATLRIRDARFPSGKSFATRLVKWTLQPQSTDNTDEYNLIFAGDEEG